MKKLFILALLIVYPVWIFSQNLDLIDEDLNTSNPGTSYIYMEKDSAPGSMFEIRRNAFVNETILFNTYERIFPVTDKFGILAKAGIMIFDPFFLFGEVSGLYFGPRHFLETGFGWIIDPYDNDEDFTFPTIRAGYRFQSYKGLLLKASIIGAPTENYWAPLIGIGFAF